MGKLHFFMHSNWLEKNMPQTGSHPQPLNCSHFVPVHAHPRIISHVPNAPALSALHPIETIGPEEHLPGLSSLVQVWPQGQILTN